MAKGYWIAHNQISDAEALRPIRSLLRPLCVPMRPSFLCARVLLNFPKAKCAPEPL